MQDILFMFDRISDWRILLDLLIIASLIYTIYRTLHLSGTWKIAVGVSALVCTSLLAGVLELPGVEWLFSNVSQVAVIALLVIFQPEIRRFLERSTGLGRRAGGEPTATIAALLDDILFDLADRHWGGLIVIPGRDPVQQWLAEGIQLDAHPSSALLLSIFDPDSPGHDGAVIIENNRVSRFGVRLPLSDSGTLAPEYGTRHHAALGLAEKTDALIFLVSEEKGTVSLFRNSQISHLTRRGMARDLLSGPEMTGPQQEPDLHREFRTWRLFIEISACLALSLLFWFAVVAGRTELREKVLTVPIEYSKPPAQLILAGERPLEARLLLEGPANLLKSIHPSQIRLQVDLAGMAAGFQMVNLTAEDVDLPKKIQLLEIEPDTLTLELKQMASRRLVVKPQFVGKLPAGLQISGILVTPASVNVVVPEGDENIPELLTTPIYMSSLSATTTVYCKIILPSGLQATDNRWPDVAVTIQVRRQERVGNEPEKSP